MSKMRQLFQLACLALVVRAEECKDLVERWTNGGMSCSDFNDYPDYYCANYAAYPGTGGISGASNCCACGGGTTADVAPPPAARPAEALSFDGGGFYGLKDAVQLRQPSQPPLVATITASIEWTSTVVVSGGVTVALVGSNRTTGSPPKLQAGGRGFRHLSVSATAVLSLTYLDFRGGGPIENGGSIENYGTILVISACIFARNKAYEDGGAIRNYNVIRLIDNTRFKNNQASNGGALQANHYSSTFLRGVAFSGNEPNDILVDPSAYLWM